MARFALIVFIAIVALLALATALTSAAASLANGVANAAASTALMTSQCVAGFMVLVAIVAGIGIGFGTASVLALRHKGQEQAKPGQLPQAGYPIYFPIGQHEAKSLPDPRLHIPMAYLPADREEAEESEDVLFKDWGW